jgi:signal transduction histidine kinase
MIFGFSLNALNEKIAASQKENEENLKRLSLQTYYIAAVILILAYLLISHLSQRVVSPIITLRKFAKELSEGEFSNAHLISSSTSDEIGLLTRDFATMAGKLKNSYQQLAEYNHTLEQKVRERTEALNTKNDELLQALENLENSQQQLIHSEKMAALGQLIAGIAHEINTPLGAIQASVGNTSRYLHSFSENLLPFLRHTSADEQTFLCTLLTKATHEKRFSTREERAIKRQLLSALNEHEIQKAEEVADMLVDMELGEEVQALLPQLAAPRGIAIVEMAHKLTGIGRNSETISIAVGRASKVVFALKHFTHHDNSGKMISSNVNLGIRTVLTLYQNLLKQGCEVIEQLGDIPEISCYPDELNQVWTNLIHNAIHAMNNKGTLTICTLRQGETILVSITDSGSGIPDEVKPHIFDSFYTTKPAGEGSGLGLGICKRIIDKHQGKIDFASEPGKTTFSVTLPVVQAPTVEQAPAQAAATTLLTNNELTNTERNALSTNPGESMRG